MLIVLIRIKTSYYEDRFQEALSYVKRQEYELMLLYYISEEFAVIDAKFNEFKKKTNTKKAEQKDEQNLGKVYIKEKI